MRVFNFLRREKNPVKEEIKSLDAFIAGLEGDANKLKLLEDKLRRLRSFENTKQGIELSIPLWDATDKLLMEIERETTKQRERVKGEKLAALRLTEEEHSRVVKEIETQVRIPLSTSLLTGGSLTRTFYTYSL